MAANLPPGLTLAVNTHLEFCSVCAIAAQAVAGLVEAPPEGARRRGKREPALLPMPLRGVAHGPWRWIGYGVRAAELRGVSGLGEEVWLLKAGTGARLPLGGERGVGAVVVLEGGFSDGADTFEAGDYIGLDERRLLRPVSGQGCLALVVSDGEWPGFLWRRAIRILGRLRLPRRPGSDGLVEASGDVRQAGGLKQGDAAELHFQEPLGPKVAQGSVHVDDAKS